MGLPNFQRVIYKNNPLYEVICQLKFPPILKIGIEPPASFQDLVRVTYPLYDEKGENFKNMPQAIIQQIPSELVKLLSPSDSKKTHEFTTQDNFWTISLTTDFIALTTHNYTRWEEFKNYLSIPLEALKQIYTPSFFSRIGLRYQNVIQRSRLGLENTEWSRLLKPYVAGVLAVSSELDGPLLDTMQKLSIDLGQGRGKVTVRHGFVKDKESDETCYLIDSDFYIEQNREARDATGIIDYFNQRSRRLFRWCITDQLHEALEPEEV